MFYDAISQTAKRHDLPIYALLGYAMAHELGHQLLPANGAYAPAAVQPGPAPTVIYADSPRVVYYDGPGYYYPNYWYPPVSIGLGFGSHGGYGFRGGFGFRGRWR